jgi:hypothetical protein
LKSSGNSPHSDSLRVRDALTACAVLAGIVALAGWWVFRNGYILYFGDAQSHLNLSRSIIDSRTPGYDQLGTVWLPMLHVICLPLVGSMSMWSSGLAGTIPVSLCFVLAGVAFFLAAYTTYRSRAAAWVTVLCLVLNPNVLYLATIPMTEVVFLAGLSVLLLALVRFEATQELAWVFLGVTASWWMSLTRYDGWFLIPFAALWFSRSATGKHWRTLLVFGLLASLAPLYWIAHNWWETSNALDFYSGPYSAIAIQGNRPYPGYHEWGRAALYYAKAGQLCAGSTLLLLGLLGFLFALTRGTYRPLLFLLLTPAFYIWSIHSSQNPIFVPQLPPHSYYNSRYGIAMVGFAAFACGAIITKMPLRRSRFVLVVPAVAVLPWLVQPSKEHWICWKEAEVNSESRRVWTNTAADFMAHNYVVGQGILIPSASGDLAGILCRARIPLRETINVGNGPLWMANSARPDLIHQQMWALTEEGDSLLRLLSKANSPYAIERDLTIKGASKLEILRRTQK